MAQALKEFFYVDVDRTRSLLAQLQGGLIESLISEKGKTVEGGASASLFGIGGSGGYSQASSVQESRSFQDMIFVAFERLADEEGLITELDDRVRSPEAWRSGELHASLREGAIVRINCDVQILDGALFGERMARFDKMADGIVSVTMDELTPRNSNPQQRQRQIAKAKEMAKATVMGGMSTDQLAAISAFVEAFVGEGISLRALPCGMEQMELGFQGALLGRREYIQDERETLFSRYGTVASNWTCVLQIAAVPEPRGDGEQDAVATAAEVVDAAELLDTTTAVGGADAALGPDGSFSRAQMESIAASLLGTMEELGLVEGPRWPTISVTPLAVYRNVPEVVEQA